MKHKRTLSGVLIVGLLLALVTAQGLAQGPGEAAPPQPELAIEGTVGSKLSYQGVLKEGGSPVHGSRDMVFRLYADDACTVQVGGDMDMPGVQVSQGFFDVELAVDQGHFDGQGLWLEAEVTGATIACHEILPAPYALSLRPGAVISGTGTALSVYSGDQYALWAETATTGDWYTAVRGKAVGTTGKTSGVFGSSDSDQGRGVFGQATADSGVTVGVYGHIYSSTDLARAVYGLASGTSGLTYGVRGDNKSSSGHGVHGRAMATTGDTYGVYGKSESADGGAGGYFTGYTGVVGLGTGDTAYGGYGGYFESAIDDGVRVQSAGDDGLHVESAGGDGVWVYDAGNDGFRITYADRYGVNVESAGSWAVYANTVLASGEWGLYTPDKIYGSNVITSGPLMLVVQNGDAGALEPGEVVVAAGLGQPFADSLSPTAAVRRADAANSQAPAGVVCRRFVAEEKLEQHEGGGARATHLDTHSTDGPVAPGEYLLLCIMGPCQVKVDAAQGAIRPGDALGVSNTQGCAARARPLTLDGVDFYPPGATLGTALEPLDAGTGLIHVLVQPR